MNAGAFLNNAGINNAAGSGATLQNVILVGEKYQNGFDYTIEGNCGYVYQYH